jgi:hypothetical protein
MAKARRAFWNTGVDDQDVAICSASVTVIAPNEFNGRRSGSRRMGVNQIADGIHGISHRVLRDRHAITDGISLGIWHGTRGLSPLEAGIMPKEVGGRFKSPQHPDCTQVQQQSQGFYSAKCVTTLLYLLPQAKLLSRSYIPIPITQ